MIAVQQRMADRKAELIALLRREPLQIQQIAARLGVKPKGISRLLTAGKKEGWLAFDNGKWRANP